MRQRTVSQSRSRTIATGALVAIALALGMVPAQAANEPLLVSQFPNHNTSHKSANVPAVVVQYDRALQAPPSSTFILRDVTDNAIAGVTDLPAPDTIRFTPTEPLKEVASPYTATVTAKPVNPGDAAVTVFTFRIDDTAPAMPGITQPAPQENLASNTVAVSGTAEANALVTIQVGNVIIGTTTATAGGAWELLPSPNFGDGTHTINVFATDEAGNIGPKRFRTFHVDTVAPAAPTISTPANGSFLSSSAVFVSGTAEAGTTVTVKEGASTVGTAVAAGGNWSFTATFAQGSHTLDATSTDASGNVSPAASVTFTVDTTSPQQPLILTPGANAFLNNPNVTITGTAEPNTEVIVTEGPTTLGTAAVDGAGNWSLGPIVMADGLHTVLATGRDAAGNLSASTGRSFTVDTVAPADPVILVPTNGATLTSNTVTVSGTAEANSTVTLSEGLTNLGTANVDGSGNWSAQVNLADGNHTVTAVSRDAAGNASGPANVTFSIDATGPAVPVILTPTAGAFLSNPNVAITGTAEPNSTITLSEGATPLGQTTADGAGNWSANRTFSEGQHTISARSTDGAGNNSAAATRTFTVDTIAPAAPNISTPTEGATLNNRNVTIGGTAEALATITVTEGLNTLGITVSNAMGHWSISKQLVDGPHSVNAVATDRAGNVSPPRTRAFVVDTVDSVAPVAVSFDPANNEMRPSVSQLTATYSKTLSAGSITVRDRVGSLLAGTVSINGNQVIFTPTSPFTEAGTTYTWKVSATDTASNNSVETTLQFGVGNPPVISTPAPGAILGSTSVTIGGTADPGAKVIVVKGSTVVGSATVAPSGAWSVSGPFDNGSHTIKAIESDSAGNSSPATTRTFVVDTLPPGAPSVLTPSPSAFLRNSAVTISGTAEAATTIALRQGAATLATTVAASNGTWSFTRTFGEGTHSVLLTSTDAAGNVSPATTRTFTVDTVAPAAPVIAAPAEGTTLGSTDVVIQGTAEPNSTVTVRVGTNSIGAVVTGSSGNWSITKHFNQGSHTISVTATDIAGNVGPAAGRNFAVNVNAPAQPVLSAPAAGAKLNTAQVTISGTAAPNVTITVTEGASTIGVVASGTGSWSMTRQFTDGTHTIAVTATDAYGRVSPTTTRAFSVDTAAPVAPAWTTPASGALLAASSVTLGGTTEPGATVTVKQGAATLAIATASASGSWSVTKAFADGTHTVVATATDGAGNTGAASGRSFTVDTTPPAAPTVVSPVPGAKFHAATIHFAGTAEASATVTLSKGATVLGSATALGSGDWSLQLTFPQGSHTVAARASDAAGNTGPATTITFVVDDTPPAVTITTADRSLFVPGDAATIAGTAADNVGVGGVTVGFYDALGRLVAQSQATLSAPGATSVTWSVSVPVGAGYYTARATATDLGGNNSPTASISFFRVG